MLRYLLPAAVITLASMLAQPALADGCQSVLAAEAKGLDTPSHSITKIATSGSGIVTLENIAAGGKIYTKGRDGRWTAEPQPLDRDKFAAYWSAETCTADGSETIDGHATDIVVHRSAGDPPSVARFSISRASGLIVKTVIRNPGSVITTVADYRNVQAPSVDASNAPAK
ncbi:MAG: hypothetical protein ABSD74_10870 [Rhizomicrobium sp.]|jgi:hypothetical protein